MKSAVARARTLAGLDLLCIGLQQMGLIDAVDAPLGDTLCDIGFAAGGRPELRAGPSFSISHSGEMVACAITRGQTVGLDVETRRADVSARLASIIQDGVAADDRWDFFDAWCAREATVKASGRVGLARIRQLTLAADHAWLDGRRWHLQSLSLAGHVAACLASDQPISDVVCQQISLDPAEGPDPAE